MAAVQAEGRTALEPAQVDDLLARYDEQVANGLAVFPVKPTDPNDKRRVKQHPATHLRSDSGTSKPRSGGFSPTGAFPSITIAPNVLSVP